MAIYFETKTPKKLLAAYKRAVDDGHVTLWSYDSDGDFTHTVERWNKKAWLRPKIIEGKELIFFILGPTETTLGSDVYAAYHGRFLESMLKHCDQLFSASRATSMPADGDVI